MATFPNLDRLKSQLLTSGLQEKNQPLYQVINQLIDALRQTINTTNINLFGSVSGGGGGGTSLANASYLTTIDETASLPNSRVLVAGDNVSFDDSVAGQRVINVSVDVSQIVEGSQLEIKQAEIEITPNRRNGKVIVRSTFTDKQVGAPVMISQVPDGESEMVFVQFIGEVLDTRRMRVYWIAPFGAPRKMKINYLIGA